MRTKYFLCLLLLWAGWGMAYASLQLDEVSFFQSPSKGIQYDYADVYLMQDRELAQKTNRYETDVWKRNEVFINRLSDAEGRFSVWKFIPNYIERPSQNLQRLVAEIILLNDTLPVTQEDIIQRENGAFLVPYSVHCYYQLIDANGQVVQSKNYGWLKGYYSTQNKDLAKERLYAEQVGIQAAFSRVRQEVYSQFGFTTFEMPFRLEDFEEIPSISMLQDHVIEQMSQKQGLFLSEDAKKALSAYTDILMYHLPKIDADRQYLAHRNLALCKAWLGDSTATESLAEYEQGLKTLQDSVDYRTLDLFVQNYPITQVKYAKMLRMVQDNLSWKVDAFTHNDLISSIFSIGYPLPIFPLHEMNNQPEHISGTIKGEGKEPIYYEIKFNKKKNRIQSVEMHTTEYADGKRNKLKVNTLHVAYKHSTGEYERIYCSNSAFARFMTPGLDQMNQPVDAMQRITHCKTDNLLGGFVKFQVQTEEENQFSIDLDGNVYIRGSKTLSRPNFMLKEIADANGEKFPTMLSSNSSSYLMRVGFNEDGIVNDYAFDGYGLMEKNIGEKNYAYIKADSLVIRLKEAQPDTPEHAGTLYHHISMSIDATVDKVNKLDMTPLRTLSEKSQWEHKIDEQQYQLTNRWIYRINYDDYKNWNYLQIGPYTIERNIRY